VRQQQRQQNHCRDVNREDAIFFEIFGAMVGAIDRRHVVRIVKEERQRVENH
jgi:hypothetical protein